MALIFLKYIEEKKKRLENAYDYLKSKLKDIKKILGDVEVYIFGSWAEGKYDILSDVDVAIVSDLIKDHRTILLKIQKMLGTPFEIHIFTKKEWEKYKKSIGKYIKVE